MPITLPTEIIPAGSISPRTLIIYGAPKIGKTAISIALENYLLLELEPNGAEYIPAMKLQLTCIEQIAGFEDAIRKVKTSTFSPYKYLIVDTLDQLEAWAEKEATRRYKASIIGKNFNGDTVLELQKGGGYLHLRNVFYEYFNRLRMLAPYTIFIGHVKDSLLGTEGKEVSSKDLDLTGKVKNIACAYADATGLAFRDKDGKLKISFFTNDTANCGSRCPHLSGKVFEFSNPATKENWKQIYPDL